MTTFRLVPLPRFVEPGDETAPFRLGAHSAIQGPGETLAALLHERTGLTVPVGAGGDLRLAVTAKGAPESYRLRVSAASVLLEGADDAGLHYGAHTLSQLLRRDDEGWMLPAVAIDDAPRFAYRGVMLDVARHFFDVGVVRAWIDRAAALKFNHLHLHLSDDQGWRLELASRPALTARASASAVGGDPGGFYTSADYAEIVAYAAARHLTVVPEIDVPGHTHAVGLAYPELAAAPVITDAVRETAARFGGGVPVAGEPYPGIAVGFSSLRIGDPAIEAFLRDVFGELAAMTPGPYLHLGGDEALGTPPDDYAAFVRLAVSIVAATGKTPMLWHEAGTAELPEPVVGQYWGFVSPAPASATAAAAIVEAGGRLVLSPADAAYLDMKPDASSALGLEWANGPTSLQRAYGWEPADVLPGVPETALLGVEAPLWTETARTLTDLDALAFPRIAAAAEIAWSPAPGDADARTWESFRRRVAGLLPLWAAQGVAVPRSAELDPGPASELDADGTTGRSPRPPPLPGRKPRTAPTIRDRGTPTRGADRAGGAGS